MKKLDKHILVVLNQKSTQEELIRNVKDAYAAYAFAAYVTAYDDVAVAAVAYAAADSDEAQKYIDKFFELSGHNIQDYYDKIKKINSLKKDK